MVQWLDVGLKQKQTPTKTRFGFPCFQEAHCTTFSCLQTQFGCDDNKLQDFPSPFNLVCSIYSVF